MLELDKIRREYLQAELRREHLLEDPLAQLQHWLDQALASALPDPTAMVLATQNAIGGLSQRIVLLKKCDARGLIFYTNYRSAKAEAIASNSAVSCHFPWYMMERQVNVTGKAIKISAAESAEYFASRPRESQIAAWASAQSQRLESRAALLHQYAHFDKTFANSPVPIPEHWGGYCVQPEMFEFWQGGGLRLHDRFVYTRQENTWQIARLSP